jgi:hypothetical protein
MDHMDVDRARREAIGHVEALKGFYIHAIVFACVMTGLVIINAATGGGWWVQWPLLGWGIGLAAHALAVFKPVQPVRLFGPEWTARQVKARLAKTTSVARKASPDAGL